MKSEALKFAYYLLALIVGGALEEILPRIGGVGFPVLLAFVAVVGARCAVSEFILLALAAGAFEDALSSLPPLSTSMFFVVVAFIAHKCQLPRTVAIVAYPLYLLWLCLIPMHTSYAIGLRLMFALPVGIVTAFVVEALAMWTYRKAALDAE